MGNTRRTGKLIQYECNKNILRAKYRFLIPVITAVQVCFSHQYLNGGRYTASQYFRCFLEGIPPMPETADPLVQFILPGNWIIFFIFLFYITGCFAKDYTEGAGMQQLLRAENAVSMWTAKWLLCIGSTLVYFGMAYLTIGLFNVLKIGNATAFFLPCKEIIPQLVIPVMAAGVMGIWQIIISMLTNNVLGLLSMCVLLVVSAYFERWYLIGNYLMKIRVETLVIDQPAAVRTILLLLLLLAAGVFAGGQIIQRIDFIRTKGDW